MGALVYKLLSSSHNGVGRLFEPAAPAMEGREYTIGYLSENFGAMGQTESHGLEWRECPFKDLDAANERFETRVIGTGFRP